MRAWFVSGSVAAFEVTYTPPEDFEGWSATTKTFGDSTGLGEPEEVDLAMDLLKLETCFDGDLKSFRFTLFDNSAPFTLGPESCPKDDWTSIFDIDGNQRVVGFQVTFSDNDGGTRSVSSVCPLLDTIDCEKT